MSYAARHELPREAAPETPTSTGGYRTTARAQRHRARRQEQLARALRLALVAALMTGGIGSGAVAMGEAIAAAWWSMVTSLTAMAMCSTAAVLVAVRRLDGDR